MQACDSFKEITLNSCPDNFIIDAGLAATTAYLWEFKNKFDNKIRDTVTTAGDGTLTIPVEDSLSKSMFHNFSGAHEFRLFTVVDPDNPQPFKFCNQFDYLVLIFEEVSTVPEPNNANIKLTC